MSHSLNSKEGHYKDLLCKFWKRLQLPSCFAGLTLVPGDWARFFIKENHRLPVFKSSLISSTNTSAGTIIQASLPLRELLLVAAHCELENSAWGRGLPFQLSPPRSKMARSRIIFCGRLHPVAFRAAHFTIFWGSQMASSKLGFFYLFLYWGKALIRMSSALRNVKIIYASVIDSGFFTVIILHPPAVKKIVFFGLFQRRLRPLKSLQITIAWNTLLGTFGSLVTWRIDCCCA